MRSAVLLSFMKDTIKQLEIKKCLKVLKTRSDIIKKVAKMSLTGRANTQELEDPAQTSTTSDSMDWFTMCNVSTLKDFKDLAQQNSALLKESQLNTINNEVEFTEISRSKRPKTKNNDHLKLTLPKKKIQNGSTYTSRN
jgi:hypothetical protein